MIPTTNELLQLSGFPKSEFVAGINPATNLKKAPEAYLAYYRHDEFVKRALRKHPRETPGDYQARCELAYGISLIEENVDDLTETVGSDKYAVVRDFKSLATLKSVLDDEEDGANYDALLNDLVRQALLGGIAYLYISDPNPTTPAPQFSVYRYDQVGEIITQNDLIMQAVVYGSDSVNGYLTLFIGGKFWQWKRPVDKLGHVDWVLSDEGDTALPFAPIVPFIATGSLGNPNEIGSPIHKIVNMDKRIINKLSSKDEATEDTLFPQMIMPLTASQLMQAAKGDDDGEGKKKRSSVELGSDRVLFYTKEEGAPAFLEPTHSHVEVTWNDVEKIRLEAKLICKTAVEQEAQLASGISKSFSHARLSDSRRKIHAKLRNVEYRALFVLAKRLGVVDGFKNFKSLVEITHPTNFDPASEDHYQRLVAAANLPDFITWPPAAQNELRKSLVTEILRERISQSELEKIRDSFKELTNDPGTGTTTATNPQPNGAGSNASSGGQPAANATSGNQ
jgi:hypothetical protein